MEAGTFLWGCCWGWGEEVGVGVREVLGFWSVRLGFSFSVLTVSTEIRLLFDLLLTLLLLGVALQLRPRRYSSAGFRKIPAVAPTRSLEVPRSDEAVPVTGSQRLFSINTGLLRYLQGLSVCCSFYVCE